MGHYRMAMEKLDLLLVEDNARLRAALMTSLGETGALRIVHACDSGEEAVEYSLENAPDVILMDVRLAGQLNGIEAAVEIRKERPRLPVVFYSIQDDDSYYRDFRNSGIISHYAYVRKSNFLLPEMILPLLRDAKAGRSFIDPDIESRVREVRHKDAYSPMTLLEPFEQEVALMLAQGMSNKQIAERMGYRDKRTISRVNGQIYTAWGLNESTADEKIARTRVAIIVNSGRLIRWDESGDAKVQDERGEWIDYD
jgi:DNA-binding NarL/FixJ family response regulator